MSDTATPEPRQKAGNELLPRTMKWLASLDETIRPKILPGLYTRIANTMAERWTEPDLMRAYFDELMVDRRGDRQGFPSDILVELGTLKHYYDKVLHPRQEDVWAKIWAGIK